MMVGKPEDYLKAARTRSPVRPAAGRTYRQPGTRNHGSRRKLRRDLGAFFTLVSTLALPCYALSRLSSQVDWRLLAGSAVALSLWTFFLYRADRRRAMSAQWRIPESTLHLFELAGGWPGAFVAQRALRHKTAKASYQFVFWTIILLHQGLAIDGLTGWTVSRPVLHHIQSYADRDVRK